MESLDLERFIMLFKESYRSSSGSSGGDVIASLQRNEMFELTRLIGQDENEDLSWFDLSYFEQFYDHVAEVYYYNDNSDWCHSELYIYNDEWACLVKLDNGFYLFMKANTDMASGFSSYGSCETWATQNLDHLLTFGLTDAYRARVEKAQTEITTRHLLGLTSL